MITCIAGFVIGILLVFYIFVRITRGFTNSKVCLIGKTAIVTGGNSGIGYEVALDLASRGCKVIIADKDNCEISVEKIIHETHNSNVIGKHLDLASFESVRNFVKDIYATVDKLDILINNAGIGKTKTKLTENGLDYVMQVNHFGPFLLTNLLIDLLKKSAPSRIIFTSSCVAFASNLTLENINNTTLPVFRYSNSKLCALITSDEFSKKLRNTGVTSNSLHPGMVYSQMIRRTFVDHNIFIYAVNYIIHYIYSKSSREGAQTTIHLATANEIKNITGKYFWDCKIFWKPRLAKNVKFCKELWDYSEKCVNLQENEKCL